MKPYRHHVFICEGKRCGGKKSSKVIDEFKHMSGRGEIEGVKITRTGCMKICKETAEVGEYSPAVVIYPEGVWYTNVTVDDVPEIVSEHLGRGRVVERLLYYRLGSE
ncbi:MAG: ferredoxin [Thermodesulfobacteriota bacterium]